MSLIEDLEPPQLKAITWSVKTMAIAIAAALALGLGGYMVWKTFFAERAAQAKHEVVQSKGEAAISQAGAQAGAAAVPIIVKNYNTGAAIDAQTQESIREALKSPGAALAVDPGLDDLGRRAICVRASASGLPDCQHLLNPGP